MSDKKTINEMKTSLLAILIAVLMATASCGHAGAKKANADTKSESPVVNVYYFHGKQRCLTCIAVGDVTRKTIAENYAGNENVKFIEIDTSDKANEVLVEKYQVTWNALIIAKGEDNIDITQKAFGTAIKAPEELAALIQSEVDKRLK